MFSTEPCASRQAGFRRTPYLWLQMTTFSMPCGAHSTMAQFAYQIAGCIELGKSLNARFTT
jgi:hypothetical protein